MTGSIVSSLQGEPRATHDADIVVWLQPHHAKLLTAAFPMPDYYLDEESILEAIQSVQQFNLIDISEGNKVDFWLLTDEPFDQSRFARKYAQTFENIQMKVSRPEDTILAKLRWAKMSGGSEKQFGDALRVFEVQFAQLDMAYLEFWVKQLDVPELWDRLKREAKT